MTDDNPRTSEAMSSVPVSVGLEESMTVQLNPHRRNGDSVLRSDLHHRLALLDRMAQRVAAESRSFICVHADLSEPDRCRGVRNAEPLPDAAVSAFDLPCQMKGAIRRPWQHPSPCEEASR